MVNGIIFAGFNIVDMKKIESTNLPVIVLTKENPKIKRD